MNTEVQKLWTDALRSGNYQQSKRYLHTSEGFCCLGVLCDLAVKAGIIPEPKVEAKETSLTIFKYNHFIGTLPYEVMAWGEIKENVPFIESTGNSIADLNDKLGYNFNQLADIIETEL